MLTLCQTNVLLEVNMKKAVIERFGATKYLNNLIYVCHNLTYILYVRLWPQRYLC